VGSKFKVTENTFKKKFFANRFGCVVGGCASKMRSKCQGYEKTRCGQNGGVIDDDILSSSVYIVVFDVVLLVLVF